jgi:hypothetical protein
LDHLIVTTLKTSFEQPALMNLLGQARNCGGVGLDGCAEVKRSCIRGLVAYTCRPSILYNGVVMDSKTVLPMLSSVVIRASTWRMSRSHLANTPAPYTSCQEFE